MHSSTKLKLTELNPQLTCVLCGGYYIDATTIVECLHSFCKTCILRYLETSKYCPICDVQIHKTKPHSNIRSDQTLQDIVYKLVPGLFKNEMKRRREFYTKYPDAWKIASKEERGEMDTDSLIFTPDDLISISLEYSRADSQLSFPFQVSNVPELEPKKTHRRYLCCPAALTVGHLKKLLRAKYSLSYYDKIDIMYRHDYLIDEYTMMDLAYIYSWRRNEPLQLYYQFTPSERRNKRYRYKTDLEIRIDSAEQNSKDETKAEKTLQKQPSPPKENHVNGILLPEISIDAKSQQLSTTKLDSSKDIECAIIKNNLIDFKAINGILVQNNGQNHKVEELDSPVTTICIKNQKEVVPNGIA